MSRNVLVVEDEAMIMLLIEDQLVDLGYTVHTAPSVESAMLTLRDQVVDMALLDVNLAGKSSAPVGHELEARGIPFVIATGYGREGVDPAFRDHHCMQKPFRVVDLKRAMENMERQLAEASPQVSARTTSSIRMM